jgi:hypothetical protein
MQWRTVSGCGELQFATANRRRGTVRLVNGWLESVTATHRGYAEMETCVPWMPAVIHEIFFRFLRHSNLGEHLIGAGSGVGFPEMSAQPALSVVDM